ncbi:hypothetical protein ACFXA3_01350 [Streptomyces sp. NPDC059456]|uniref:hypothetical protein n=1 Tax=Streptomyces sp. NPDC059456 TaxID=3346838 RepID=UPI0036A2F6F9
MTASHLLPERTGIASLVLIVNDFLSCPGMEMNAVHVNEPRDRPRNSRSRCSWPWAWSC